MPSLGVDLGSSSIKAGTLDLERSVVHTVRWRPFPDPVRGLPPAWFEVDPEQILAAVRGVLGDFAGEALDGILICGQMGGVLLTDDQLRPQTNYLSWRDQRLQEPLSASETTSAFDALRERIPPGMLTEVGRELRPGGAPALLFWLAETGRLPAGATRAMGLGDWVIARLCEAEPKSERTHALGCVHLGTGEWHRPLFARLGFGNLQWPELVRADQPAGDLVVGGRQVPCFPALGDHQAALFGTDLAEGELSINASTGSQVSQRTGTWTPGDYQTRPYFDGTFLNTITHMPAGRALNGLIDLLTELPRAEGLQVRDPWGTISRSVDAVPATDLQADIAFFASAMGDRGHFQNVRLENLTLGHLFRAAFRNMAENYAAVSRRLSPSREWTRLVLSGGLPQKLPALRNEIVSRFACPWRSVEAAEETLHGLLRLAATRL